MRRENQQRRIATPAGGGDPVASSSSGSRSMGRSGVAPLEARTSGKAAVGAKSAGVFEEVCTRAGGTQVPCSAHGSPHSTLATSTTSLFDGASSQQSRSNKQQQAPITWIRISAHRLNLVVSSVITAELYRRARDRSQSVVFHRASYALRYWSVRLSIPAPGGLVPPDREARGEYMTLPSVHSARSIHSLHGSRAHFLPQYDH